jgi:hypothetical protein
MRREVSSRSSTAGSWQSSTASCSSISGSPVVANGASIAYARRILVRPVAEPNLIIVGTPALARPSSVLGMASDVAAYNLPAQVRQLFGVTL